MTHLPLTHSGLPGHYYTDPDIFRHEQQTIWSNTWQMVGRVEDLPNPGDYLTYVLGLEPIVVIRTSEGKLQAMYNVCAHRGSRLLNGQGNCKQIRCPYHFWTYDLEGQLSSVFQPELFPKLDKSEIRLLSAQVDTWGGFIFVNPDSSGESLAEYLGGYADYLSGYEQPWEELREVASWSHEEPINWKLIIENCIEDYHFKSIHKESLSPLMDSERIENTPNGRHFQIYAPYAMTETEKFKDYGNLESASLQGYIFPGMTHNASKNRVSVWRFVPLSPTRTRLETMIYQTPAQQKRNLFVPNKEFDEVMEEDFAACRLIQAVVNSRGYRRDTQLAVGHETGIPHFHRVLSEYY